MENPAVENALYWLGWMLVLSRVAAGLVAAGVVLEFAEGWLSSGFHKTVDDARTMEITRLTRETEGLKNENLKLALQIAPRKFTQSDQRAVTQKIAGFKGIKVDLGASPELVQSIMLSRWIAASLKEAGWKTGFGIAPHTPLYPGGIVVETRGDPKSVAAGNALAAALNDVGLFSLSMPTLPDEMSAHIDVFVVIGEKPRAEDVEEVIKAMAASAPKK